MVFEPVAYPDYHAHLPEDAAPIGRVVQPTYPAGWRKGIDPTGGQLLADRLLDAARAHGARGRLEHEVVHLVRDEMRDDRPVVGVEARTGTRTVLIGARRGVIFASGGFLHDADLSREHLRGPVLGGAASDTATGDFVRIGIEAGARLGNMAHAWWDQVAVEMAVRTRSTSKDIYSPFGDSMLMVNRHGLRVVNEKAPYNERGQVHHVWDPTRLEYPNLLLFMIFDDDVMQSPVPDRFRWPVPMPGDEVPRLVASAPDLASLTVELRARLRQLAPATGGIDLADDFTARLTATIDRFNHFARAGCDEDFRRGESPIERTWAGPPRGRNPLAAMHPLRDTGPYHAVIVGPGALDTKGGPVVDARARVLDVDGHPIPGLFAAGNCAASPAGQAYWGPGGTIGPAVTFGHLAAETALAG
jgi:succinate dehydrogenase/fumarate reductase flavoprotein subunit